MKQAQLRTYFRKGRYFCPVCLVGNSNQLVLEAVRSNQKHNAQITPNVVQQSAVALPAVEDHSADDVDPHNTSASSVSHLSIIVHPGPGDSQHDTSQTEHHVLGVSQLNTSLTEHHVSGDSQHNASQTEYFWSAGIRGKIGSLLIERYANKSEKLVYTKDQHGR